MEDFSQFSFCNFYDMSLPLCPCGLGKFYEDCCYKIKGKDGEPLFFKGSAVGDNQGNWHPLPNVRLDVILVGKTDDKYRDFARNLANKSSLKEEHHNDFIDAFAMFFYSYEELLLSLKKPHGKGVTFQMDSLEVRHHWKQFLFNGRVLIDFIGLYCRSTLNLNQEVGGLNSTKFESLLKILQKQGQRDAKLLAIAESIKAYKADVLKFIAMRDREKSNADTIAKFPAIDSELGMKNDGELNLNGEITPMIKFIENSFESILSFTKILLDISDS